MHDLLGARRQCAAVLARIYEFFLSSISCMADFCELEAKDSPIFLSPFVPARNLIGGLAIDAFFGGIFKSVYTSSCYDVTIGTRVLKFR